MTTGKTSEQEHSPEPWSVPIDEEGYLCINCQQGTVIALPPAAGNELLLADFKRIVACVNACRGITADHLKLVNEGLLQVNLSPIGKPSWLVVPLDAPSTASIGGK